MISSGEEGIRSENTRTSDGPNQAIEGFRQDSRACSHAETAATPTIVYQSCENSAGTGVYIESTEMYGVELRIEASSSVSVSQSTLREKRPSCMETARCSQPVEE
jgi:hypothetical protein